MNPNDEVSAVIVKIAFGDKSEVYPDRYLDEMRRGEWTRWNTPRKYKHLETKGNKLILYDSTRKALTLEVEIQEVKEQNEDPGYPWSNVFTPGTITIYETPIPVESLRQIEGFKNFSVYKKDRSAYRNVTAQQYESLIVPQLTYDLENAEALEVDISDYMIPQIALMLNGPSQWYENLSQQFEKHGRTWLQQNGSLNPQYEAIFDEHIKGKGYFIAFGYVQNPVKKVNYLLHINLIASDSKERIPPPDKTAPDFDTTYDVKQGKCCDDKDFKYVLWLRVIHMEKIDPINPDEFISSNKEKPLRISLAPHYYVNIAEKFIRQAAENIFKRKNAELKSEDAIKRAVMRMVKTAKDTVAGANGQQVLQKVKEKENRFRTDETFNKYVTDLLKAQNCQCAITGLELQSDEHADDQELIASLDRIDSDGHYEPGNLQVVCRFVNRWKSDGNDTEFRRLMSLVQNSGTKTTPNREEAAA